LTNGVVENLAPNAAEQLGWSGLAKLVWLVLLYGLFAAAQPERYAAQSVGEGVVASLLENKMI
jgi:hypothetical protein